MQGVQYHCFAEGKRRFRDSEGAIPATTIVRKMTPREEDGSDNGEKTPQQEGKRALKELRE